MMYHFLVRCGSHFDPHWQEVPLKYTKGSAKCREVFAARLQVHLVGTILQINQDELKNFHSDWPIGFQRLESQKLST